ncbi:DUF6685 family protein [Pantoea rodasii]|uniref:DUF6685 family protein n=1 Tax=Pantoea rodasii TaxID=1076549 RepID=UPI00068FE6BC|nr:DUF6685 family protein [Pantoea rodasii]
MDLINCSIKLSLLKTPQRLIFDFMKIESLTASKGFGCGFVPRINGSWFRNLSEWGGGMYPGDNLRSSTMQDWQENIWHIEHEGFSRSRPINVTYYGWYRRYIGSNTGGSHHAAKVAYQGIRDKLTYKREAVIQYLSINTDAVSELDSRFISLIFLPQKESSHGNCKNSDHEFRNLLKRMVRDNITYLEPVHYIDNIKLAFIPRENLKVSKFLLDSWIKVAVQAGKVIDLKDYLNNPETFHTKPYIHELSSIHLGIPYN